MHSLKLFQLNMKYNINGTTGSGNVLKKYIYLFASVCMLNPFMHYKWPFYLLAFKKLIRFMNHFGALVLFLTFSFCQKKRRRNGLCGLSVAGHDYESIPGWYVKRPVGSSLLTLPLSLMFSALKFSAPAASQCIRYVTLPTMHNGLVINLFL